MTAFNNRGFDSTKILTVEHYVLQLFKDGNNIN
jgi:hypothetical protein